MGMHMPGVIQQGRAIGMVLAALDLADKQQMVAHIMLLMVVALMGIRWAVGRASPVAETSPASVVGPCSRAVSTWAALSRTPTPEEPVSIL